MAVTFENVFDVSAEKENGRLVRLRRAGYVHGLTSTDPANYIEEISQASAIPRSNIVVDGQILYYKKESIVVDDQSSLGDARVDLIYERGESGSSDPNNPSGTTPTLRGGSSLKQIETAVDRTGVPITVSHTWPVLTGEDLERATQEEKDRMGKTETQGGTIRVLVPMSTVSGTIRVATNNPGAITKAYIGSVNSTAWQDGDPRTWMCTQGTFDLVDDSVSPRVWDLSFTFEYDDQTWDNDTAVRFIDPLTGQPPPNLVDGQGIKRVEYPLTKNFHEDF